MDWGNHLINNYSRIYPLCVVPTHPIKSPAVFEYISYVSLPLVLWL